MAEETLSTTTNNEMMADALNELVRLNYDTIEAYQTAMSQVEPEDIRAGLREFTEDCRHQIEELNDLVLWMGAAPLRPHEANYNRMITRGRLYLGGLRGKKGVLAAVKAREEQAIARYQQGIGKLRYSQDMADVLKHHLDCERRHLEWLDRKLRELH